MKFLERKWSAFHCAIGIWERDNCLQIKHDLRSNKISVLNLTHNVSRNNVIQFLSNKIPSMRSQFVIKSWKISEFGHNARLGNMDTIKMKIPNRQQAAISDNTSCHRVYNSTCV